MLDVIPLGQPILVGHYSEKADRNYRERANNKITKGYATLNEAKRLEQRVQAAGQNKAIFLDDPDATEKLETKIARLEARQKRMKAANKLVRANDRDGLRDMGFSEVVIQQLFEPDFMGRIGFANYLLTNNNANIRRLKKRLTTIAQYVNDETTEKAIGNVRIVDNADENRLQIFFPNKPIDAVRSMLKSYGFRWTPSLGCWQAYRGNNTAYWAEQIVKLSLVPEE